MHKNIFLLVPIDPSAVGASVLADRLWRRPPGLGPECLWQLRRWLRPRPGQLLQPRHLPRHHHHADRRCGGRRLLPAVCDHPERGQEEEEVGWVRVWRGAGAGAGVVGGHTGTGHHVPR